MNDNSQSALSQLKDTSVNYENITVNTEISKIKWEERVEIFTKCYNSINESQGKIKMIDKHIIKHLLLNLKSLKNINNNLKKENNELKEKIDNQQQIIMLI